MKNFTPYFLFACILFAANFSASAQVLTASGCSEPSALQVSDVTYNSAILSWDIASASSSYCLRQRISGDPTWTYASFATPDNSRSLSSISSGVTYEVQLCSVCGAGDSSAWSDAVQFTTLFDCVVPTNLLATNITTNSADVSWDAVSGASKYCLRYREIGSGTWIKKTLTGYYTKLIGLNPHTEYEWKVKASCGNNNFSNCSSTERFNSQNKIALTENVAGIFEEPFPNPSSDFFTIRINPSQTETIGVTLSDLSGRIITTFSNENVSDYFIYNIDVSQLPSGVYVLRLSAGTETHVSMVSVN